MNDLNIQLKTLLTVDYPQAMKKIAELQQNADKQLIKIKLEVDKNTQSQLQSIQRQLDGFRQSSSGLLVPSGIDVAPIKAGTAAIEAQSQAIKGASSGFSDYKAAVKDVGVAISNVSDFAIQNIDALASVLITSQILKVLGAVKDALMECARASIEFETALALVRKTTDFSVTQMQKLKREIQELAKQIPLTVVELSRVAEIAGQLNIPQNSIMYFTRVMADLGATTTLTSAEAADFVARFPNITQMPMDNWDRFASSLVHLGNNFAGTETEIAAMSLRLASAGKQMGMTEADTLGLAAGLNAVGLRAEMAGTAFSRVMNRINVAVHTSNAELENFARVAGMSAEGFKQAFKDDGSSALIAFVTGLAYVERHGKNTVELMDEIGLREVRMSDALRRAAGSGELFTDAIRMSNMAWKENVALQNEAEIRYATTESQLQLLKNSAYELKTSIGDALAPMINSLAGGLATATSGVAKFLESNKWLVQTLTPLIAVFGGIVAGVTAYAAAVKMIKTLELSKYFKPIIDGFKDFGSPDKGVWFFRKLPHISYDVGVRPRPCMYVPASP